MEKLGVDSPSATHPRTTYTLCSHRFAIPISRNCWQLFGCTILFAKQSATAGSSCNPEGAALGCSNTTGSGPEKPADFQGRGSPRCQASFLQRFYHFEHHFANPLQQFRPNSKLLYSIREVLGTCSKFKSFEILNHEVRRLQGSPECKVYFSIFYDLIYGLYLSLKIIEV